MSEAYFKDVDALKGPVLALLKKEGYQAVDMHYHTRFSVDGLATVPQVLNKCKKDQIGMAFTDHNHIGGALKAVKLAKKDVFVIPGMEVTCHNGVHVLLHFYKAKDLKEFYEKDMKKRIVSNPWFIDLNYKQLINLASKYKCLITIPHPYGPGFCGIMRAGGLDAKMVKKIHAVEAINGCGIGHMNIKAIKWGKKIKKPFTGGSDGHCLAELGTSLTICKAKTVTEFLDQVKKGNSIVIGKEERLLDDAIHAVGKFIREEKKTAHKQVEKMWKDRGLLEWNYFKKKLFKGDFHHHYHAHHSEVSKSKLSKHKHTKHLAKK